MCLAGTLTHNRCPQRAQQQQVIGLLDTCELTLHSRYGRRILKSILAENKIREIK